MKPAAGSETEDARKEENERLQRKLMRIVVSDFLCWIPISIMSFCQLGGIRCLNAVLLQAIVFFSGLPIPSDVYLPIGLIVIPINSVLNPFLYSNLPDILWEKTWQLREWIRKYFCLSVGNSIRGDRTARIWLDVEIPGMTEFSTLCFNVCCI